MHRINTLKFGLFAAVAALTIAIAGLGSSAPTASAAPGNGATPFNDSQCFDAGGGYTYCFDQQGVYNDTVAGKSGNVNYVSNGKGSYQLVDPLGEVVYEGSYKSHYKVGYDEEGLRVLRSSYSDSWSDGVSSCSFSSDYHLTENDGVIAVQYDRFEAVCTP